MNVNDIKSFLSGTNLLKAGQNESAKAFVAQQPANQVARQDSPAALSHINLAQHSVSLGIKVVNHHVMNRVGGLEQGAQDNGEVTQAPKSESLFDFDAVISNVLEFVGNVINNAKDNGASDDKLKEMMAQAREGVDMGFADARKELEELNQLDDDLEQGIQKAYDGIQTGLDELEASLFAPAQLQTQRSYFEQESYEKAIDSSLKLKTADGDIVTINFSQLTAYQHQLQVQQASDHGGTQNDANAVSQAAYYQQQASSVEHLKALQENADDDGVLRNASLSYSSVISQQQSFGYEQQAEGLNTQAQGQTEFYQAVNFSFNVEGELDQDELKAIADLVGDISSLVNEFVEGEPDKAFEQALQLGFDEDQISGFAFQYTQVERYRSMKVYDEMSRMAESPAAPLQEQAVPIAKYASHLLALVEASKLRLNGGEDFVSLMDEVANEQLKALEDAESLNERFAQFNQKLLSNLPDQHRDPISTS